MPTEKTVTDTVQVIDATGSHDLLLTETYAVYGTAIDLDELTIVDSTDTHTDTDTQS